MVSIGGGTGGGGGGGGQWPAPTKFSPGGHRPHDQWARDQVSSRAHIYAIPTNTDHLDLRDIASTFISANERRPSFFGRF